MALLFGAAYLGREAAECERSWRSRVRRLGERRLLVEAEPETEALVRVRIRARAGERVPFRTFGALVKQAIGPEREERAEFWLIRPGQAGPGPLRLEGAGWQACLEAVAEPEVAQLRFFSPMLCAAGQGRLLAERAERLGLDLARAGGWAVVRRRSRRPQPPPPPPPWRGNYGW
ncbi:MAG: hypothetical protein D6702_07310 [Planctomycetota bacterium]|nr:MAG: hypothetical protein D6702_07310 [Planctomycetota bacterium]